MAESLPPAPPADSLPALRSGDRCVLGTGARVVRIYFREGDHPGVWNGFRNYGPLRTARFDHHEAPPRPQERAILYGSPTQERSPGTAGMTCVAEAFQEGRTIDPSRRSPWLVSLVLTERITLLDVTSGWTTRAGGNQAISHGERRIVRQWSRAIYERYPQIQGVLYASSTYGPGRAVALFERAQSAIAERPAFHRPLSDPGLRNLLIRAAGELHYELLG